MYSYLIVSMLIGGVPFGPPIFFNSIEPDCRSEILTVEAHTKIHIDKGSDIRYIYACEQMSEKLK